MEWTQENRYRPYSEWSNDYVKDLKKRVDASSWRTNYHIQPETGLLNDPNGFSYFNGRWHLFYQSFPFGTAHGLKSWQHMASKDLIHWESEGLAIVPDSIYDSHGAYSGSAIPVDEKLFLAYTGNVRDEVWERHSYQLGAWLNGQGEIEKVVEPLIQQPPTGITAHFRDPQIIRYEDEYLMIIGGQTDNEKGEVLVFTSQDLADWQYQGPMKIDEDLGFMVECPNLLFIEDQTLLLLCPQGLDKSVLDYQNVYPNTYILADRFLKEESKLGNPAPQQLLDEGFDLYATQAFTAPDGRCLSIGWIGLPEMTYPTFDEGWAHCLSLVKELTIKGVKLYQYPVAETKQLRKSCEKFELDSAEKMIKETENCYELQLEISANNQGRIHLFSDKNGEKALTLSYDTEQGIIRLDRSKTEYPLNPEFGEIRESAIERNQPLTLTIYVDSSTSEIFINGGEKVLTANYYPAQHQKKLVLEANNKIQILYYELEK
ncbi:sucrose-6-phosphate hydrolase [Enterococcus sp.]|uniref:sucrose-6-phosphate hydrolase n=1 Tax=Enterococcus sp. TaxID=35783 RepID=UPI002913F058|nr:sucrose-6-phosphate hydrolase [Enterococcus sp.]MDU5333209.1 sucrose-6-phosphate hydrolase [Enterococcus sp.]